jgi:predicted RNase H-like HicB family nuclease
MEYTTRRPIAGLSVCARRKGSNMEPDIQLLIETLDFRVFIDFDEDYGVFVARCLETGAVATGKTIEEAESLITSVLQNDFRIATEQKSIKSLLHGRDQTPFEAIEGWYQVRAASPETMKQVTLDISSGPQKRGVQSEHGPKLKVFSKPRESSAA